MYGKALKLTSWKRQNDCKYGYIGSISKSQWFQAFSSKLYLFVERGLNN